MNAFQRFVFNLFICCCGLGFILFGKIDCYAFPAFSYSCVNGNLGSEQNFSVVFRSTSDYRIAIYLADPDVNRKHITFYTNNSSSRLYFDVVSYGNQSVPDVGYFEIHTDSSLPSGVYYCSVPYTWLSLTSDIWSFSSNPEVRVFTDLDSLYDYIASGTLPQINYDDSLNLDYFKVSPYKRATVFFDDYKYDIGWSDSRISRVVLRIDSTLSTQDFVSSSSPMRGSFKGSTYANLNGDTVRLIATPYKSDGSYGNSLYYSFKHQQNSPLGNLWRKLFNDGHTDNTIDIPYNGKDVKLTVDGVNTTNNYKVNYNPVTNEITNEYIYEIYYSPVIIYPDNVSDQEVDDTQEEIINNYTTNNYYETTKNINFTFDVSFGDISTGDIVDSYNEVGGFLNGFGGFIGNLANWFSILFPFLPPVVSVAIVVMFGIVVLVAIVAFVLKIAGVIADFIDAVIPL